MTSLGNEAGECFQFLCLNPSTITVPVDERGKLDLENGKEMPIDKFAIGNLAGFDMALQVAMSKAPWFKGFQMRDRVKISCIGIQKAQENSGNSDMPEFEIAVERD